MNRHDGPLTCKSERIREVGCAMRGSGSSSPARVIPRGFVCVLPLLSICVVFMVQPAVAATWPVSTSGLSATLAFHQSYTAGIESYVHSGIDIPASAGMQISSPLAGTVRFTGTVPSGDSRIGGSSSARTMKAVSIELADGRAISLMPFASIAVREASRSSRDRRSAPWLQEAMCRPPRRICTWAISRARATSTRCCSSARPPAPRMILGYPAWEGRAPRMQGPLQQKGRPVS